MSLVLKQIRRIVAEQDVRDPRAALVAIEKAIADQPVKPKKRKPFFAVKVFAVPEKGSVDVAIDYSPIDRLNQIAVTATLTSLAKFATQQAVKARGDNCQTEQVQA